MQAVLFLCGISRNDLKQVLSASVGVQVRPVAEVMVAVAVPVPVPVLLADVVLRHRRAVPANDTSAVFAGHARLKR